MAVRGKSQYWHGVYTISARKWQPLHLRRSALTGCVCVCASWQPSPGQVGNLPTQKVGRINRWSANTRGHQMVLFVFFTTEEMKLIFISTSSETSDHEFAPKLD